MKAILSGLLAEEGNVKEISLNYTVATRINFHSVETFLDFFPTEMSLGQEAGD